ncbi:MAG: hypothetical protein IPG17_00605 [Sandaracinaceae bacterium]|nr:hypothetical protein [Sandaracinaceae bacterium]MBP7682801.1 hypothetical protein [Deltaproteobacteria bacterium]MBK6811230.1 hypothetical protein [Sandaracinaceae bacterium]MBK7151712.1 hypothetical protein [Sandaracinaceae bacterium]MBK7773323.1 hypothetical protein [Sandaracinaceae bacterium]
MSATERESEAQRALRGDIEALSLALEKLGVLVREEPLPEPSPGGLARVGTQRLCFVPRDASLDVKRNTLLDALRRLPTEELFLHPRLRALLAQ